MPAPKSNVDAIEPLLVTELSDVPFAKTAGSTSSSEVPASRTKAGVTAVIPASLRNGLAVITVGVV